MEVAYCVYFQLTWYFLLTYALSLGVEFLSGGTLSDGSTPV